MLGILSKKTVRKGDLLFIINCYSIYLILHFSPYLYALFLISPKTHTTLLSKYNFFALSYRLLPYLVAENRNVSNLTNMDNFAICWFFPCISDVKSKASLLSQGNSSYIQKRMLSFRITFFFLSSSFSFSSLFVFTFSSGFFILEWDVLFSQRISIRIHVKISFLDPITARPHTM